MRDKTSRSTYFPNSLVAGAALGLLLVTFGTGCVGTLVNLMHAAHGNLIPAKFSGLKEKRVAVVCVSNSEAFGPTAASVSVAQRVAELLGSHVDDIDLVPPQEISAWIDRNDWDYLDYKAVGRGVNADMVLAIDLDSFSLHEGKTLFKGRADVSLVLYDMQANGMAVFTFTPNQIEYPANMAYHTTNMSERAFRRKFIEVVSRRIARQFYAYEAKEDFAHDATVIQAS